MIFDAAGVLYISSDDNITQFILSDYTNPNPVNFVNNWWTGTAAHANLNPGVPHKFFEYQGVWYMTDGNYIHKIYAPTGTAHAQRVFTIDGYTITDAVVHNNLVYLTVSLRGGKGAISKVIVWNGVTTTTWADEITINVPRIDAIKSLKGRLFFFSNGSMYELYPIGAQYEFIYYIGAVTHDWKNVVIQEDFILASAINGVFCYDTRFKTVSFPIKIDTSTYPIKCLRTDYNDVIDLFTGSAKLYRADANNATGVTFYSNPYDIGPVLIKKVSVIFKEALSANADYTFSFKDEKDSTFGQQTVTFSTDSGIIKKTWQVNKQVDVFQFLVTFNHAACKHIRSAKIEFESSEKNVTK